MFDPIITDWSLGSLDGADFLLAVHKTHSRAKVLLWSANIGLDKERAVALGFVDFLVKPFDLDQLSQAVSKASLEY